MVNKPTKIFPCECGGQGVSVVVEECTDFSDCKDAPFIEMAFWELQAGYDDHGGLHLGHWERIKYAWRILRGHSPWTDMVWMRAKVAQNLANHILYLISRAKKKQDESKMLVKPTRDEQREYEEYQKIVKTDWPENDVIREDKLSG